MPNTPMFIYVCGPYSPPATERDKSRRNEIIEKNIYAANEIALSLIRKGHVPFVPHTMMKGWEDIYQVPRERALEMCHLWVQKCDALYFIASSYGADSEREIAIKLNIPVFYSLDDINSLIPSSQRHGMDKPELLLEEWKDIRESLRYFGNKRFAQLTVFIAATGFLASSFLQQISLEEINWKFIVILRFAGTLLGILFLVMELRSAQYIETFASRGREIEAELGHIELIRRRPTKRGFAKVLTGTYATYTIYLLAIAFWCYNLIF